MPLWGFYSCKLSPRKSQFQPVKTVILPGRKEESSIMKTLFITGSTWYSSSLYSISCETSSVHAQLHNSNDHNNNPQKLCREMQMCSSTSAGRNQLTSLLPVASGLVEFLQQHSKLSLLDVSFRALRVGLAAVVCPESSPVGVFGALILGIRLWWCNLLNLVNTAYVTAGGSISAFLNSSSLKLWADISV